MSDAETLQKFHEAAKKATWAYLATAVGRSAQGARGASGIRRRRSCGSRPAGNSAKGKHIAKNPKVELFYQAGPDFVHLTVTGTARFIDDAGGEKARLGREGL